MSEDLSDPIIDDLLEKRRNVQKHLDDSFATRKEKEPYKNMANILDEQISQLCKDWLRKYRNQILATDKTITNEDVDRALAN